MLLIEQVDRLSRLNDSDWAALKREIGARGVRIVALDDAIPIAMGMARAADASPLALNFTRTALECATDIQSLSK